MDYITSERCYDTSLRNKLLGLLIPDNVYYPGWGITKSLDEIFREIIDAWKVRLQG